MNIVFEGFLYIVGGLIRCVDLLTDIWYVYTQEFETDWLYYTSFALILSPSVILFLIFFFTGLPDLCRGYTGLAWVPSPQPR